MANAMVRVMLVDDHAVVRMGFKLLLEGAEDISVVAEAESGEEALKTFQAHAPDVLVMDISMPGIGGLETIDRVLAKEGGQKNTGALWSRGCYACTKSPKSRRDWLSHETKCGRCSNRGSKDSFSW